MVMTQPDILISRLLAAPIEDVFAAWTEPATLARWLWPGDEWSVEVRGEARLGGAFSLRVRDRNGAPELSCSGVYSEFVAPTLLAVTLQCGFVIRVELQATGEEQTRLSLLHLGIVDNALRAADEAWAACPIHLQLPSEAPGADSGPVALEAASATIALSRITLAPRTRATSRPVIGLS